MNKLFIVLSIFMFVLNGCATPTTPKIEHTDGTFNVVQNEMAVEEPIEVVWTRLVDLMADPYFEVIGFNEKTHTVIFSFTSDKPCNYLDCGIDNIESEITIPTYEQGVKHYNNPTCAWATQQYQISKVPELGAPYMHEVLTNNIFTYVDGEATTTLEDLGDGTSIVINVDYTFNIVINQETDTFNAYGELVGQETETIEDRCKFATLYGQKCPKLDVVTCFSTGVFEKVFLNTFVTKYVVPE